MGLLLCLLLTLFGITLVASQGGDVCLPALREFVNSTHKEVYRVGVLAIRGTDAAYNEFNKTFSEYLTATAGQRFDPPIRFDMVPQNFIQLFDDVEKSLATDGAEGVDFIYVNPSAFSCIESEYGADTLVSQISRRVVGGQVYELTRFGGVIFTLATRSDINSVEDLRDKIIAAASISGLGSGQMQFRLLQQRGLSYIQDPKQLVFTSNQGKVVNGVLNGDFDVGFVRTDQIERTKNAAGELVDPEDFKIIEGTFPALDGKPFPFESSTILYPEWNVGSLPNVAADVSEEVQSALLNLDNYAEVADEILSCIDLNCGDLFTDDSCEVACVFDSDPDLCDTTTQLSTLAQEAKSTGKYSAWRATLSYMELRNMQEETRFIRQEEDGINRCIRTSRIYDAVVCPDGHFRRSEEELATGCDGPEFFNCTEAGFGACLCKPCVKAFDVDVFPASSSDESKSAVFVGCDKFAICGEVEQSKQIKFYAVDNKERQGADVRIKILEGEEEYLLESQLSADSEFTYEFIFDAAGSSPGTVIIEVSVDDEQIPESPFRLTVLERDCANEFNDELKVADNLGNCICDSGSHDFGSRCVSNAILIPSIIVPVLVLLGVAVFWYVERKRKQADAVWEVNPDELHFDDPPAILGRGTFGLVLLARYRGTQVAVKRVIPPKVHHKEKGHSSSTWRNSLLGEGDITEFDNVEDQKVHLEFDEAELKAMDKDYDFESGRNSGPKRGSGESIISSTSTRGGRRHSLNSKFPQKEQSLAKRRNSFFDFENLEKGRRASDGSESHEEVEAPNIGMQSGGINVIRESLQPNPSRRHSIGTPSSFPRGQGAIAKRHSQKTIHVIDQEPIGILPRRLSNGSGTRGRLTRRYSNESVDSMSSQDIENAIMATMQQLPGNESGPEADENESVDEPMPLPQLPPVRRRHSLGNSMSKHIDPSVSITGRTRSISLGDEDDRKDDPVLSISKQKDEMPQQTRSTQRNSDGSWLSNDNDAEFGASMSVLRWDEQAYQSVIKSGTYNASGSTKGERSSSKLASLKRRFFGNGDEYARLKADFITEMRHLSKLRHPCITTVMGAVVDRRSEPMLVMEYMDHGSLYDLLHNDSMVIDGELLLPILKDITQGVRFLHAANPQVIHGDLKAQNVLVDSKFRAKVADFGLSQKKRVGATGTPLWMAPELLRGDSENTDASDVYSFGIILYEVYSRKDPYQGENPIEVIKLVCDPNVNKRPPVPKGCPGKVASIMTDCLVANAEARPSFEELDMRLRRLDVEQASPKMQNFSLQERKKRDLMAARNEELLFQVFPRHVAEALRDGKKVEAESFDCVTVFFSDIVGYTTISSKLHPRKVSDMLDRLYLKFDNLSTEHEVFKIETIGDAYICVTNLADHQPDHAARIARFAIDAMQAANETLIDQTDPSKGFVKIRVGFHSGPIVADVVGSRSPKYTLFGDTVNTASRMESHSLPLRIQCSDRSTELIREQDPTIRLLSRGKIPIKGKGEMLTYWVNEEENVDDDDLLKRQGSARRMQLEQTGDTGKSERSLHLDAISEG